MSSTEADPAFFEANKQAIEGMNCLRQLRKNAENGKFIPAISKFNSFRAHWLHELRKNNHQWNIYFENEWRGLPDRLKKEADGTQLIG